MMYFIWFTEPSPLVSAPTLSHETCRRRLFGIHTPDKKIIDHRSFQSSQAGHLTTNSTGMLSLDCNDDNIGTTYRNILSTSKPESIITDCKSFSSPSCPMKSFRGIPSLEDVSSTSINGCYNNSLSSQFHALEDNFSKGTLTIPPSPMQNTCSNTIINQPSASNEEFTPLSEISTPQDTLHGIAQSTAQDRFLANGVSSAHSLTSFNVSPSPRHSYTTLSDISTPQQQCYDNNAMSQPTITHSLWDDINEERAD